MRGSLLALALLLALLLGVATAAEQDHYGVLGVRRGATANEIKRAFRRQSLLLHPDKARSANWKFSRSTKNARDGDDDDDDDDGGDDDATSVETGWQRCVAAHDVLTDADARAAYDAEEEARRERTAAARRASARASKKKKRGASSSSSPRTTTATTNGALPLPTTLDALSLRRELSYADRPLTFVLYRGGAWCEVCDDAETHFFEPAARRKLAGVARVVIHHCDDDAELDDARATHARAAAAAGRGGDETVAPCALLHLDADHLPMVLAYGPRDAEIESGAQITKPVFESEEELNDALTFVVDATVAAHGAGIIQGAREGRAAADADCDVGLGADDAEDVRAAMRERREVDAARRVGGGGGGGGAAAGGGRAVEVELELARARRRREARLAAAKREKDARKAERRRNRDA